MVGSALTQGTVAVEQKQAEATVTEQTRLTNLIGTISTILGQRGTLAAILERCAWVIPEYLEEIALARIWILHSESQVLELQAIGGSISEAADLPPRISLGISIIGLIAQTQKPYLTNNALQDICIQSKEWLQSHGLVAFVGYPLIVEERLLGVVALSSRQPISDMAHNLLQCVTDLIAIGIDRVQAREELLSKRESLLFRLANHIRNSLDLDKILEAAVHEIWQLLQIDRCHYLWCWLNPDAADTPEALEPILSITHEAKQPDLPSLLGECNLTQINALAHTILNSHMIRVEDICRETAPEPAIQEMMQAWGVRSQLLIPVETRSGQLGAIVCGHSQAARLWTENEVELLQAVGDQLAIAIDQAELYAQSRAAALTAQTQADQLTTALQHLRQTQSQLIQSEKMSSLGQLVAGIAHEINNPVTFVSGNLAHASHYFEDLLGLIELYQEHYPEPDETIQNYIDDIDLPFLIEDLVSMLNSMKIGAERIYKIVLSLRNFSRLDEAEVKAVDLHNGIDSTLLILQNRMKAHGSNPGIEVVKEFGQLPLVNCYASQLNQVFMNLLSNAIDALSEQPSPRVITIQTEVTQPVTKDDTSIIIRIRDNGSGMSEAVRQRIFDPFYTTKPVGQGTGLGLSISHQIVVERHKGQIYCQSTVGAGTEFTIEIPLLEQKAG
ncbi:MAG TPA: ATP-binding protein [Trichocoleus sp.]|jgi:signal transduction histidine kinase